GAEVTLDLNSPNFGKVVVGKTHYDFTGGHRAPVRLVAQLVSNLAQAGKGDLTKTTGQTARLLLNFARQNSAPVPAYLTSAGTGKEITGEEFKATRSAIQRIAPFFLQDVYEAWQEEGGRGVMKAAPASMFGVGVQTYEPQRRTSRVR